VVPFCVISSIQSMSLPKMASHSFDPREALLAELRQKFPEVFTEAEIDLEKMQNFLQCKFSEDKDRYRMTWAGRKAAIQQVQVKTTDTLVPEQEQSVNFETTGNVFIEGDNLEVLRVLQKSYYGKVKMIYIDPPYNTGKDFIYHDDFKQIKAITKSS
jgi:adenine-specific DNA-methyltransferase